MATFEQWVQANEKKLEECWKSKINFSAPNEHIGDIERLNRTIEDRFRVKYHMMPCKVIPRPMICHLTISILNKRNIFPKRNGISKYYSPQLIVNKSVVDFEKHLRFSFGTHGQASYYNKPKSNDDRARTLDIIYLCPSPSLQGGHDVMDLAKGVVVAHPKWTPCKMTDIVVKCVEKMAAN